MLIAMAGLPASGKSAVARPLAAALPALLLDKDAVRVDLFGEHVDYRREQNDLVVDITYRVGAYVLGRNPTAAVLLDGRTYSRRYQVVALEAAAREAATPLRLIECVCSPESAIARLERDAARPGAHPAADRDVALYLASRAAAEPVERPRLVLDTDAHTPAQAVELALEWLRSEW